jgi:hypothetical protein
VAVVAVIEIEDVEAAAGAEEKVIGLGVGGVVSAPAAALKAAVYKKAVLPPY